MPRICAREGRGRRVVRKDGSRLTIIGTFVVRTLRMQTSENEFKQNGSKRKLVLVLCAVTGFR